MKYLIGFGCGMLSLAIPLGIIMGFSQESTFSTGLLIGSVIGGPLGLGLTLLVSSKKPPQQQPANPLDPQNPTLEPRPSQIILRKIPPRIPDQQNLDRAILLLGNRTKSALKPDSKAELIDLIGEYPDTKQQAAAWKAFLKRYKKDPQQTKSPLNRNENKRTIPAGRRIHF